MATDFNILDYLSGLTNFVFDKSVLNRVALKCGVADMSDFTEMTDEKEDRCKMMLLETIVYGPHSTASSTNQHGSWTLTVGSQAITEAALESIKSELKRLYKKYGEDEKLEALEDTGGMMQWIDETEYS